MADENDLNKADRRDTPGAVSADLRIPNTGQQNIGADSWMLNYSIGYTPGVVQNSPADWFGPLNPMSPVAPEEVKGRILDFPSGYNLEITPRAYEPIKFADLRALADGFDVLRLVIETRKDQMDRLPWEITPRDQNKAKSQHDDPTIKEINDFFQRPDKKHDWNTWLRRLLEDLFVLDATSIYRRRTRGGKLYALEQLDGGTIKRVIDDWGRTPEPPVPAYQQILKGFPAINYTTKELLYLPRNLRVHKFYGYSPTEQVLMTVNIALRRQLFMLQYYTEGNMPEGIAGTPGNWTPKQIADFQTAWDAMLAGNQAIRRRIKFVPGEVGKTFVRLQEPNLTGEMDDWLTRVVCFAFSISPMWAVSAMNRATANTAQDVALEEGLQPIQAWVKRFIDQVIAEDFGRPDLEFSWRNDQDVDRASQATILRGYVEDGILEINEARDQLGMVPSPQGKGLRIKTGTGYIPVDINDDGPTAGEQHDAEQSQADAKLKADTKVKMAAAKNPKPAPGASAQQSGGSAQESSGSAQESAQKMEKIIRRLPNGKWRLRSHTGKNLGTFDSKEAAEKHEAEVEHFKEVGKSADHPFAKSTKATTGGAIKLRPVHGITHRTKEVRDNEKELIRALIRELKAIGEGVAAHAERMINSRGVESHKTVEPLMTKITPEEEAMAIFEGINWDIIVTSTAEALAAVATAGGRQALLTLEITDNDTILEQTYQTALEWAQARAAEMVGMKWVNGKLVQNPNAEYTILDRTRDEIRSAVADAIENGLPAAELADNIVDLEAFSESRAMTIARTEIIRANNAGHLTAFAQSGVVHQKEWSTAEDGDVCPICTENEDVGPIDLARPFPSGDQAAPGHPNCRCTIIPYIEDESVDNSDQAA